MNARRRAIRSLSALLVVSSAATAAEAPTPTLPPVQAQAVLHVADCDERALPSQREVGEWTGQHNFSQVYATRKRLMAEIGRACQQPGIARVRVVAPAREGRRDLVALAERR